MLNAAALELELTLAFSVVVMAGAEAGRQLCAGSDGDQRAGGSGGSHGAVAAEDAAAVDGHVTGAGGAAAGIGDGKTAAVEVVPPA